MTEQVLYSPTTGEPLFLFPEEREAFLAATRKEEPHIKYFCQMLYYTGARLNEVLGITYSCFDFEGKRVRVKTLKQRGRDASRFIELPDNFIEVIGDVFNIRAAQTIEKKKDCRLWGFTGRTGENYIKKVMTSAGISGKKANAMGLRHAFGFVAAMNHVPTLQLQEWLGHQYPNSTIVYNMLQKAENPIPKFESRQFAQKLWNKV